VKNGVPFDVAFQMDDMMRAAQAIIFSEFEGNKFDFRTMDWKKTD